MKKSIVISLWMALLCASAAFAEQGGEVVRMQHAIDMRVDSNQFMGSVLIVRDGEVLLDRAYGQESVGKADNQTDTRFRVGPVTRQLTAASILLLEERGKLKLDDPISRYMPDAPEEWSAITFRHLLMHTSGLPNITTQRGYDKLTLTSLTPQQLVEHLRDRRLDFAPGTNFSYSISGYLLLGYLIEKISGETYGHFLQEHFFRPLKMANSGYDPNAARMPHQAQGHLPGRGGLTEARAIDMSALFSSSGVYSTSGDLLKWERALYGGHVLHPAQLQQMLTPANGHYGMGVMIDSDGPGASAAYCIGGGVEGFNTQVVYEPRSKLTIIVLSNVAGDAVSVLASDLRKVATGERVTSDAVPVTLKPQELDRLAGYYWSEEATIYSVVHKDDHLIMAGAGGTRHLVAQSKRDFFAQKENVEVTFMDEEQGHGQTLLVRLPGRSIYAERITPAEVDLIRAERQHKVATQAPTPGSDAALRRLIEEIVAGTPDYSRLGPAVGGLTRRELPHLQPVLASMGVIKEIDFLGLAPQTAADVYAVTFTHGRLQALIALGPDGKIWSQEMRSGQGSPPLRPAVLHQKGYASVRRHRT